MKTIDLFGPDEECPKGGPHVVEPNCLECGRATPPKDWIATIPVAEVVPEPAQPAPTEH